MHAFTGGWFGAVRALCEMPLKTDDYEMATPVLGTNRKEERPHPQTPTPLPPLSTSLGSWGGALSAVQLLHCARSATIWVSGRTRDPYFEILGAPRGIMVNPSGGFDF